MLVMVMIILTATKPTMLPFMVAWATIVSNFLKEQMQPFQEQKATTHFTSKTAKKFTL